VKLITKSGDAYYFVYDPTASIPAVVYEAAGTTAYLNVREPSGALISREKYEDGDLVYSRTYHFDGLGSTIALTDENGVTTDTYSYDAWGNATHTSGTTADNPYQYVGKYGYYTHWQEPTLNLLQLGVRYYDPSVGRFTQIDPVKDGLNWYGYVRGNPVAKIDPGGLYSWGDAYNMWTLWTHGFTGTLNIPMVEIDHINQDKIFSDSERLRHAISEAKDQLYSTGEPSTVVFWDRVSYVFPSKTPEAWTLGEVTILLHGEVTIYPGGKEVIKGNMGLEDRFDFNRMPPGEGNRGSGGEKAVEVAGWLGENIFGPANESITGDSTLGYLIRTDTCPIYKVRCPIVITNPRR